jgi:hypothetical protein
VVWRSKARSSIDLPTVPIARRGAGLVFFLCSAESNAMRVGGEGLRSTGLVFRAHCFLVVPGATGGGLGAPTTQ